jgi:hypothetical protein
MDFAPTQQLSIEVNVSLDFVSVEGFDMRFSQESVAVAAPATLALFGLGLVGLGWSRRKKE